MHSGTERTEQFLRAVVELSRQYGLSISHEDTHGSFVITAYDQSNIDWLLSARREEEEADG